MPILIMPVILVVLPTKTWLLQVRRALLLLITPIPAPVAQVMKARVKAVKVVVKKVVKVVKVVKVARVEKVVVKAAMVRARMEAVILHPIALAVLVMVPKVQEMGVAMTEVVPAQEMAV